MLFLMFANFYLMNNTYVLTLFLKYVSYINPVVVCFIQESLDILFSGYRSGWEGE